VCSKNQTDAHNTRKPRKWESSLKAVRPVTIDTTLKNYAGNGAYLAIYVTDTKASTRAVSGWPAASQNTTSI
jgi:hypothetical protein